MIVSFVATDKPFNPSNPHEYLLKGTPTNRGEAYYLGKYTDILLQNLTLSIITQFYMLLETYFMPIKSLKNYYFMQNVLAE